MSKDSVFKFLLYPKNIFYLFLMMICFACKTNTKEESHSSYYSEHQPVDLNFTTLLNGMVGEKYKVKILLSSNEGKLTGQSFYQEDRNHIEKHITGKEFKIQGNITNDGKIIINEYNTAGEQVGRFKGIYTEENKIEGVWDQWWGKGNMPFYLIAQ